MLQSSLGFHTMTLFLPLSGTKVEKLIKHFCRYRKNTKQIRIFIRKNALPGEKTSCQQSKRIIQFIYCWGYNKSENLGRYPGLHYRRLFGWYVECNQKVQFHIKQHFASATHLWMLWTKTDWLLHQFCPEWTCTFVCIKQSYGSD